MAERDVWNDASWAMRERAQRAAASAYPDPEAMIRAVASLFVVPPLLREDKPTVRRLSATALELSNRETTIALSGGNVPRILTWEEHMREHGDAWAETYLAGVSHGLAHAAATKLEDVLADIEARRASREEGDSH